MKITPQTQVRTDKAIELYRFIQETRHMNQHELAKELGTFEQSKHFSYSDRDVLARDIIKVRKQRLLEPYYIALDFDAEHNLLSDDLLLCVLTIKATSPIIWYLPYTRIKQTLTQAT